MNIKELKQYARKMLDLSIEQNKFNEYVACLSNWSISLKDEYGNVEECIFAKMEAIYEFHKENPSFLINDKLYSNLKEYASIIKGSYNFMAILRMIEYQIAAENENRAAFHMNNTELLETLKNNLHQNEKLYKSDIYEQKKFWSTIEQHNESLDSNYGHKLL